MDVLSDTAIHLIPSVCTTNSRCPIVSESEVEFLDYMIGGNMKTKCTLPDRSVDTDNLFIPPTIQIRITTQPPPDIEN